MRSTRKYFVLRNLERFFFLFVVAAAAGLTYLYTESWLSQNEVIAGLGILALGIAVRMYLQHVIDVETSVALSQSNFVYEDVFTALFDRSPVAYLIITVHGQVQEGNAAAVKLLGTDINTIVQMNFFQYIQETEKFNPDVFRAKIRAGATLNEVELLLRTVDEREVWVLLSMFAYRGSGERLVSMVDITEKKHIDTAKSEFVALATHQLRTPIAAIRWNVELLEKSLATVATEAQARYLEKVNRNVIRMISLINDFLSVSKLEMGTYAAEEEDIDLTEYFTSIYDEYANRITEKEIILQRVDQPQHAVIRADRRLFHIIVSNLVSNAVKYLKVQGTLQCSYALEGNQLTVVVADNGIGIPSGEIDKLFTKFYRASNAQSHQTEGTGLGLYIVEQSVQLLGGAISVASEEDKGTTFTVVLPVTVVSQ